MKTGLSMLLLAASAVAAADRTPPPGSHGFNWLEPESQCHEVTEAEIAAFASCEANNDAFGLALEAHACKVDADTELMVYPTAAQCQQALETMQANGP